MWLVATARLQSELEMGCTYRRAEIRDDAKLSACRPHEMNNQAEHIFLRTHISNSQSFFGRTMKA